jgi:hypothetical protein
MRLQKSPNAWSCLPTAFAIAIGCPVKNLIARLGHDGSDIQWPGLVEPLCRRGYHVQELVQLLWKLGYTVTPIESYSRMVPCHHQQQPLLIDNTLTFDHVVNSSRGVLTGKTKFGHAVAYDHGTICDPRGLINPTDFSANCAWIINT